MNIDKSLLSGSNGMLILKLLEEGDRYGYQMIEELAKRSDKTFELKAGTLYPVLHTLEEKGWITAYDAVCNGNRNHPDPQKTYQKIRHFKNPGYEPKRVCSRDFFYISFNMVFKTIEQANLLY